MVGESLLTADPQERLAWLKQALADGEKGEAVDFTEELMLELSHEAESNAAMGKPVKDAILP